MATQRPERVQEALRQEISNIVQYEIKDPRIGFITITRVELTRDLRFAKVYFSVLGDLKSKQKALRGLTSAKGYIKGLIPDRVKLRFMPEIVFKIDDSLENAAHIYDILNRLKKERENGSGDRSDKKVE